MEETEITNSEESVDTSAESTETPVATESEQSTGTNDQAAAASVSKPEDNVPFHMHPRFQEVIAQKNEISKQVLQYQKQMQEMQMQMQSLQSKMPKEQIAVHPGVEKLKQADKDFYDHYMSQVEKLGKLDELEKKLKAYDERFSSQDAQALEQTVTSKVNSLYDKYKVPEDQKFYVKAHLRELVESDKNANIDNLETYFKTAVDKVFNGFSSYERKKLQDYVVDKKKDAAPASTTGGKPVPKAPPKLERSDIVSMIAKEMRAAKQPV